MVVRSSLGPLLESAALIAQPDGLQLERSSQVAALLPSNCVFISWDELDVATGGGNGYGQGAHHATTAALEPTWAPAVSVITTMVVNGISLGELQVRQWLLTHSWGSELSLVELAFVRKALVTWGGYQQQEEMQQQLTRDG